MVKLLNIKNKNRKGISFFYMIVPFMLVLWGLLFIAFITPNSSVKTDFDFGKSIQRADIVGYKFIAEEFYKDEFIEKIIKKSLTQFSKFRVIENFNFDRDKLQGCSQDSLNLWYNQKNIDDNLANGGASSQNDDVSCSPQFSSNLEEEISKELEQNLNNIISDINNAQNMNSYNIRSDFDSVNKKYKLEISSEYLENTRVGSLMLNYTYKLDFDIGEYINLLKTLKKILPKLSDDLKSNVPKCIQDNQANNIENLEQFCFQESVKILIKKEGGEKLLDVYDIDLSFIDSVSKTDFKALGSKEYFGLKFLVSTKNSNGFNLEFGVILEDNIPYNLINFRLENFEGLDNVIKVIIEEPQFDSEKINKYIVLYSYDNFFDQSYSKYNELLKLLQDRKIPNDFENTGFKDSFDSNYYYSDATSGLNLNLLNVNSDNFDDGNPNTKEVLIYQSFDYTADKYVLLENNYLYVYVFAVDFNNNYYVDNIAGKTIAILPKPQFGPKVLEAKNIEKISGNEVNMQNGILVKIKDYLDYTFDHYDVYVRKSITDESFTPQGCEQSSSECFHYNGQATLREPNFEFYITSDSNFQIDGAQNIIYASEFSRYNGQILQLENNQKYDIAIIPVNKDGQALLRKTSLSYNIVPVSDNFYTIDLQGSDTIIPFTEKNILIQDKKKPLPTPGLAISIDSTNPFNFADNNLFLQWSPIEDIRSLKAFVTLKDATGNTISVTKKDIGIDGIVNYQNSCSVIIDKIMPYDSSGNGYDPLEYSGGDYYQFSNLLCQP